MSKRKDKPERYARSYEEIAQELGITTGRVRQIIYEATRKLKRNPATLEALREYWQWSTEQRQGEGFVARDGIRL